MNRNTGKCLRAERKLMLAEERQSGTTMSEVCRRHEVHHTKCNRFRKTRGGKREEYLVN